MEIEGSQAGCSGRTTPAGSTGAEFQLNGTLLTELLPMLREAGLTGPGMRRLTVDDPHATFV